MYEPTQIARYRYFPRSFAEGREWFRHTAAAAGGRVEAATHPWAVGPDGESLSTELAWFGAYDAPRVFVAISGTHGQEYFAGAATQLQWMAGEGPRNLPQGLAVCLVHAHNPFGAAHLSRCNENFVDLNRNYFDDPGDARANPLYAELFELLFTAEMNEHILDEVMAAFYAWLPRHEVRAAMTAIGGGQVSHPSGILYCGRAPEWSTLNLKRVMRQSLGRAGKVALVDLHTGIGGFGVATVLAEHAKGTIEHALMSEWWSGLPTAHDVQGEARPEYFGTVCVGAATELRARGAQVVDTVIEFGTFENEGVLAALLIDRWLRVECKDSRSPQAVELRTKMAERLNPSLPEWRTLVLQRGADLFSRTLAGLASWSG